MEIGANSTILVAKVNKTDSGNYSCSIGESQQYTILVHVLNGKERITLIAFCGHISALNIKIVNDFLLFQL